MTKRAFRLPQYGLKRVLSFIYLPFYIPIRGLKLFERTIEHYTKNYGFCPECGNSYQVSAPEDNEAIIEEPKFYRNEDNKKIAGVCAGIADYTDISLMWIRILSVIGAIVTFVLPGIIVYVLCAKCIPAREHDFYQTELSPEIRENLAKWAEESPDDIDV